MDNNIPYYDGNIYESKVLGLTSIPRWIEAHRNPTKRTIDLLDKVREASLNGDDEAKFKYKSQLHYITPAVRLAIGAQRRYDNILEFNGYMQLDFDKLSSKAEAVDLRDYLFETYEPIVCTYLSPSEKGVKGIIQIPIVQSVDEFKDYHKAIEDEMKEVSTKFDHATINCVLPLFISRDPDIKYRLIPETWTTKGDRTVEYVKLNAMESEVGRAMPDFEKSLKSIALFKSKIDEIISDGGHPRLRDACLVLGSRVGAGYIDIQHAIELAEYAVSTNSYLKKKRNTYLKTALWCINQGVNHPKYY